MSKKHVERCDRCGEFVPIGEMVVDGYDEALSICKNCDSKNATLPWKVHLPNLLKEIMINPGMWIFNIPINITGKLLAQVGERAAELNDPELNRLMCLLTIYTIADPHSPDYDPDRVREIERNGRKPHVAD